MNAVRVIVVAALAAGTGVLVWYLKRGGECQRFADKICAVAPGTCGDVKMVFNAGGVGAAQCRDGNKLLAHIDQQPPGLQVALATAAFSETVGAEAMFQATRDAMMLMLDIDYQIEQGRAPDDLIARLRALGPPACSALLARFGSTNPKHRDFARKMLTDLRGQDLGADAAAWRPWCNGVFLDSLKRK